MDEYLRDRVELLGNDGLDTKTASGCCRSFILDHHLLAPVSMPCVARIRILFEVLRYLDFTTTLYLDAREIRALTLTPLRYTLFF